MASKKKVSPELIRLRALARKDRAAVTQKIYRIRKSQHVELSGSKDDPRRDVSVINTYNASQLRNYIQKLEAFSDRGVQFVSANKGTYIPQGLYKQYKSLERQYNKLVDARNAERADYILPGAEAEGSTQTVGQREQYMLPKEFRMNNAGAKALFTKQEINASNIAGEFGLKKLIQDITKRLQPNYLDNSLTKQRQEITKMLAVIGDKVTIKSVKGLTPHQFDVLFNSTKFVKGVSDIYFFFKALSEDAKETWYNEKYSNEVSELQEAIEWASELPENSSLSNNRFGAAPRAKKSTPRKIEQQEIKVNKPSRSPLRPRKNNEE
jgi:hypothetical protein